MWLKVRFSSSSSSIISKVNLSLPLSSVGASLGESVFVLSKVFKEKELKELLLYTKLFNKTLLKAAVDSILTRGENLTYSTFGLSCH